MKFPKQNLGNRGHKMDPTSFQNGLCIYIYFFYLCIYLYIHIFMYVYLWHSDAWLQLLAADNAW